MRALLQRVRRASVSVDGGVIGEVGQGYLILLGVRQGDTKEEARFLAQKTAELRVFEDAITFKIALMVVRYMKYMETLEY